MIFFIRDIIDFGGGEGAFFLNFSAIWAEQTDGGGGGQKALSVIISKAGTRVNVSTYAPNEAFWKDTI